MLWWNEYGKHFQREGSHSFSLPPSPFFPSLSLTCLPFLFLDTTSLAVQPGGLKLSIPTPPPPPPLLPTARTAGVRHHSKLQTEGSSGFSVCRRLKSPVSVPY